MKRFIITSAIISAFVDKAEHGSDHGEKKAEH